MGKRKSKAGKPGKKIVINLINMAGVRRMVGECGLRVGDYFYPELDARVNALISKAVYRAAHNGRLTVRECDV